MNLSSPRTALKLLAPTPMFRFCSRCGTPPHSDGRVCAHCGMGLVLSSPLRVTPTSVFLVLDSEQRVSAVSACAERHLEIEEWQALGRLPQQLHAFPEERTVTAACGPPPGTLLVLDSSAELL